MAKLRKAERAAATLAFAVLAAWLLAACGGARHHVVERTGPVDEQRCIMTTSDERWTVTRAPEPESDRNR
jgi:hypothetical protein